MFRIQYTRKCSPVRCTFVNIYSNPLEYESALTNTVADMLYMLTKIQPGSFNSFELSVVFRAQRHYHNRCTTGPPSIRVVVEVL